MTTAIAPPAQAQRPTLATKVAWNGAASAVSSIGGSIAGIFAARYLGAAGMGQLAFLVWMLETFALVIQLGLAQTLTRFVAETRSDGLAVWLGRRMLALTAVGALLFVLLTPKIARTPLDATVLGVAALLFCVRGADAVGRAYLIGIQDFRALARLNLVSGGVLVAGVAVGGALLGLPGVLLGYGAAAAVGCVVVVSLFWRARADRPDAAMRRRLRRFAGWLWVGALVGAFSWSQMELLFLERLASHADVGYFAVGVRVTRLATTIPLMLGGAFLPHFAERLGANDHETVRSGYAAGTRCMAMILFPLCIGLAATAPLVIPMLYGAEFEAAVPTAMALCVAACFAVGNVGSSLIFGADKSHVRVRWAIVAALMMVGLLLAVVPEGGALGAAWVRVGVRGFTLIVAMTYVARYLRVPVPVGALARILVAALISGAGAWALVRAWPTRWILLAAVPVGAILYLLGLRLLRAVDAEDAAAFRRFFGRAPRMLRGPLRWMLRIAGER